MDSSENTVVEWLLDSDPAIRWQVMRDLTNTPSEAVAAERARVATEGWGARLLALQGEDGYWAGGAHFPASFSWSEAKRGPDGRLMAQPWTATSWSLTLLWIFGLPPDSPESRRAIQRVRENVRWEYDDLPFFNGETDACINGRAVGVGAYFGEDVSGIVDRLLGEQMEDGGWNCEQENGSTRGSFHSTISVLEGLLQYEMSTGPNPAVSEARRVGEAYLLDRRLLRRLTTGEIPDEQWTRFSFPYWWRYDALRGLDYLRAAGVEPDERIGEALSLVEAHRGPDGRWPRQNVIPGDVHFDVDGAEGAPSRWNTLRALRVLEWAGVSRPG
jgi:hypothetical protein